MDDLRLQDLFNDCYHFQYILKTNSIPWRVLKSDFVHWLHVIPTCISIGRESTSHTHGIGKGVRTLVKYTWYIGNGVRTLHMYGQLNCASCDCLFLHIRSIYLFLWPNKHVFACGMHHTAVVVGTYVLGVCCRSFTYDKAGTRPVVYIARRRSRSMDTTARTCTGSLEGSDRIWLTGGSPSPLVGSCSASAL